MHRIGENDSLLERTLRACAGRPSLIVVSPSLTDAVAKQGAAVVVNDAPERGMSHSLRLADERIDPSHAIAVIPADLLHITSSGLASIIESAEGSDVTFPMRADGTPGHPVVLSPRARTHIKTLPDGDTIRRLRDRPDLSRHIEPVEDSWPYADVDYPSDLDILGE